MLTSLLLSFVSFLLLSSSSAVLAANPITQSNVQPPSSLAVERLQSIDHFIVLMFENESFDQLFPDIPGTESLVDWMAGKSKMGIPYFEQVDVNGNVLGSLPPPLCSGLPCSQFPAAMNNTPFLASTYWAESTTSSFDVTHRYYQEQFQINGGAMDKYVTWGGGTAKNSNGVLVPSTPTAWAMQYWDVSHQYMGALAQNFTVFDRFFHSYFGGSTPGAVSVFAGDLPMYNGSSTGCPISEQAQINAGTPDPTQFKLDGVLDANCRMINDIFVEGFGSGSVFVPTTQASMGDLLDQQGISWTWFAQSWNEAYAQRPAGFSPFAYHHHAPLYYQALANFTSDYFMEKMQDELNFFSALASNSGLPSVSYVRPSPADDMHPAQNNPVLAQAHLQEYFDAIFSSEYWLSNKTAVLITFDENGGYFDHVPPYVGDADGPGTRIPAIVISPFHSNGGVNSQPYENLSFLKMLQTRYGLSDSTIAPQRVGTVRDLTNSFAEPSATVLGDPQFTGFHGQQYQVHGVPGEVYNVLTASDVLVNARFALIGAGESLKWHDMKVKRIAHELERMRLQNAGVQLNVSNAFPLPITKSWTHVGTYLSEVAIRLDNGQLGGINVFLRAGGYPYGIQEATVNGQPMLVGQEHRMTTSSGASAAVTLSSPHTVRLDHPLFTLTLVNSDGFFNLEQGQLLSTDAAQQLDGLLGQTASSEWKASESEEQREALIFDFMVSEGQEGLASADFVKNKYQVKSA